MRRWMHRMARILAVFGLLLLATTAYGQQNDPTKATSGARPFITILLDSSASMEWTAQGEGEYPKRDYSKFDVPNPYPGQPEEYKTVHKLGVGDGSDDDDDFASTPSNPDDNPNPLMFGPCVVWEPQCSAYERPSWNPDTSWTSKYGSSTDMGERLEDYVRGDSSKWGASSPLSKSEHFPVRLLNHSQSRHVTFKEVMTGEMVLRPRDLKSQTISSINWQRYGPGCWFVPRQRGASYLDPATDNVADNEGPICCSTSTTDGQGNVQCTSGMATYDKYPDHDDPRPHIQEVYDGQLPNGLMDNLGDEILFAVASFDSFKFPLDGLTHGTAGVDEEVTVNWGVNGFEDQINGGGTSFQGFDEDSGDGEYNLGVHRIIGPKSFPTERRYVSDINEISQLALADTGTLKANATSLPLDYRINPPPETDVPGQVNLGLNKGIGSFFGSMYLSQRPIAKSTPLAPAIYDIHEFFTNSSGPVENDPFLDCRPKHVVIMTDGIPLPEKPAGGSEQCESVGTEGLSEAFRMDDSNYSYRCTEEQIRRFVNNSTGASYHINDAKYDPRVHVVGLNIREGNASSESIEKLASMANNGKTCAGWYLGNRTSSEQTACGTVITSGTSNWIPKSGGDCRKPDHPCLVDQSSASTVPSTQFSSFSEPSSCPPSGWSGCDYPALILKCNNKSKNETYYNNNPGEIDSGLTAAQMAQKAYRECHSGRWYGKAMQQIFNSILKSSGLASRTRPAITNELDDKSFNRGGQYRLYSGVRVNAGHPVWQGVLIREKRECKAGTAATKSIPQSQKDDPCDSGSNFYTCFHEEIEKKITRDSDGNGTEDNRRIFTTVPQTRVFDYGTEEGKSIGTSSCGHYHSTYLLEDDDARGEFQETYMDLKGTGVPDNMLNHRRVPFEFPTLKNALDDPLSTVGSTDLQSYFGASSDSDLKALIDEVRGRTPQREERVLGAILNSNPAAVEPPKLNVPIESYREFKARYAERPTMLYFGTLDGMLHAVHTGVLDDSDHKVQVRTGMTPSNAGNSLSSRESKGAAEDQREAWAYIPQMLHDDFAQYRNVNPTLMDGSPTVKDVRLCHDKLELNQNYQACRVHCEGSVNPSNLCQSSGTSCVSSPMQWRTVLVQGLGISGSGYFALDVTRPGGPHPDGSGSTNIKRPDPVPLWEFSPSWEFGQVKHMVNSAAYPEDGKKLLYPPSTWRSSNDPTGSGSQACSNNESDADYFWKQPFLGKSVSDPAIGTVIMPPLTSGNKPLRRAVAVFGGGDSGQFGTDCDRDKRSGRAIYVVDLQTGSILRRFVGYQSGGSWHKFDAPITGSPTLHSDMAGSLTTRGFIGDAQGRLFRIDFTDPNAGSWDPANWEVTLFFDPDNPTNASSIVPSGASSVGPAALQPAVALGRNDNLIVIYGLGEPGDTTSTTDAQMLIAVKETTAAQSGSDQGDYLWHLGEDNGLKDHEKLTGKPVIFNRGVYFTTYYLDKNNVCAGGNSRIWGLEFETTNTASLPNGLFDCGANADLSGLTTCDSRKFEPEEQTLIRGLTITMGPTCTVTGTTRSGATTMGGQDQEPQLIAQTGGADPGTPGGTTSSGSASSSDFINRLEVGLDAPRSQTIPMSWSVVNQ